MVVEGLFRRRMLVPAINPMCVRERRVEEREGGSVFAQDGTTGYQDCSAACHL